MEDEECEMEVFLVQEQGNSCTCSNQFSSMRNKECSSCLPTAAGVLPVFIIDDQAFLYLGRESYRHLFCSSLLICDFGGSKKVKRSLFECACEEFLQESLGCFFNQTIKTHISDVSQFISDRLVSTIRCIPKTRRNSNRNPNRHRGSYPIPKSYQLYVIFISPEEAEQGFERFKQTRKELLSGKFSKAMSARSLKDYCEKDLLCGVRYCLNDLKFSKNLYRREFFQVITSPPFEEIIEKMKMKNKNKE